MIIFYNKKTGEIVGTVDGRIHGQEHANMWIGDKNETDRLIIQWVEGEEKEVVIEQEIELGKKLDKDGFYKPITRKVRRIVKTKEYEPNVDDEQQKQIHIELDKNPIKVYNYKVDVRTKKLVLKQDIDKSNQNN